MGAFRDLLHEAESLGVLELNFRVRLGQYKEDSAPLWQARALLDPPIPTHAVGRTGEEALRELVKFLHTVTPPMTAGG